MSAGMRLTILIFWPVVVKVIITEPLVMTKSDMEWIAVCVVKLNLSLMLLNVSISNDPFTCGENISSKPTFSGNVYCISCVDNVI